MLKLFLLIYCLSFISVYANKTLVIEKERLMDNGAVFDLPEIKDVCQKDADCKKEAMIKCESKNAKFKYCSEQYRLSWITTCICIPN